MSIVYQKSYRIGQKMSEIQIHTHCYFSVYNSQPSIDIYWNALVRQEGKWLFGGNCKSNDSFPIGLYSLITEVEKTLGEIYSSSGGMRMTNRDWDYICAQEISHSINRS